MWVEMILFLFLAVCAVFDGIWKRIPIAVVWLGILTALLLRLEGAMGETSWLAVGLSVTPGIMFLLLSFISGEKVGYGDGWVLFMIGAFLGAGRCFLILLAALMAESFLVHILLAFGKIHRDGEIPFVPFLLLGMGVVVCF